MSEREPVQEQESQNDDLGWQKPVVIDHYRAKFHYFTHEPRDRLWNWQRSLCRRYGMPSSSDLVQDIEPIITKDSCKKCVERWERAYGSQSNS